MGERRGGGGFFRAVTAVVVVGASLSWAAPAAPADEPFPVDAELPVCTAVPSRPPGTLLDNLYTRNVWITALTTRGCLDRGFVQQWQGTPGSGTQQDEYVPNQVTVSATKTTFDASTDVGDPKSTTLSFSWDGGPIVVPGLAQATPLVGVADWYSDTNPFFPDAMRYRYRNTNGTWGPWRSSFPPIRLQAEEQCKPPGTLSVGGSLLDYNELGNRTCTYRVIINDPDDDPNQVWLTRDLEVAVNVAYSGKLGFIPNVNANGHLQGNQGPMAAGAPVLLYIKAKPPNRPTALFTATPGATAGLVRFDASASSAAPLRTIRSYEWDFFDGGIASGVTTTHTFTGLGPWIAQLRVTDDRGESSTAIKVIGDALDVSDVTIDPSLPSVEDDAIEATVTFTNTGITDLTGITPVFSASPDGVVGDPVGGTSPFDLPVGASEVVVTSVPIEGRGEGFLQISASGTGQFGPVEAGPINIPFDVAAGELAVDLHAPDKARVGSAFEVTATVATDGSVDVVDVVPELVADPGTASVSAPDISSIPVLSPGEPPIEVTWEVTPTEAGDLALDVSFEGKDDTPEATVRTGRASETVAVADGEIVVNSDGDEPIDEDALEQGICSVNLDPPSGEPSDVCTLRAAIELANDLGGTQSIGFDIPGAAIPVIRPVAYLPSITSSVIVDGSTQASGFVALDGVSAQPPAGGTSTFGLVLEGGTSTVRGLIVTRFDFGIYAYKGTGHHIVGNRVGIDDAGLPRPNEVGVAVATSDVTVGGERTGAGCTGDCNVISGNSLDGVRIIDAARATITGNLIGVDATGTRAVGNSSGIRIVTENPGGSSQSTVTVGGATPLPGTGLGNVISGNRTVGVGILHTAVATIRGNLIGPAISGTTLPLGFSPAGASSLTGVFAVSADSVIDIGGPTAADGNVISGFHGTPGFDAGIETGKNTVQVRHNRIGTNRDGTAAIPNTIGVSAIVEQGAPTPSNDPDLTVIGNVVSGNQGTGVLAADVVQGNRIGTSADGSFAVPNAGPGVENSGVVGGDRPVGSTTCVDPCNLISGNDIWAIWGADDVRGNFIGTNLAGTGAVPNGRDFDRSHPNDGGGRQGFGGGVVRGVDQFGGASAAVLGTCDRACNLVAGNLGPGVDARVIQGNVIGESITGAPLGNNGGVRVVASEVAAAIGGEGALGNRIAHNRERSIEGLQYLFPHAFSSFEIRGNSITGNEKAFTFQPDVYPTLQHFSPSNITSAIRVGGAVEVSGVLASEDRGSALGRARVDLYAAQRCEVGAQTEVPLGSTTLPSITDGSWTITSPLAAKHHVVIAYVHVGGYTTVSTKCVPIAGARGGARTITTADAAAGDKTVEVASNDGFAAGDYVQLDPSEGGPIRRVDALGSLIFGAPLPTALPAGTEVLGFDGPPGEDDSAPTISISSPAAGQTFAIGASASADFECADPEGGVGLEACVGTVADGAAIDTSTAGSHTFAVDAWDGNGNATRRSITYTVTGTTGSSVPPTSTPGGSTPTTTPGGSTPTTTPGGSTPTTGSPTTVSPGGSTPTSASAAGSPSATATTIAGSAGSSGSGAPGAVAPDDPQVEGETLPRTGSDALSPIASAALCIAAGAVLVLLSRRQHRSV